MPNAVHLILKSKQRGDKIRKQRNTKVRRKPTIKRSRRKYKTGIHKSPKCGPLEYRSSYERDYAILLDANPEVVSYLFESLSIPYLYRKRRRKYIPDFIIKFRNGSTEVHEVKPLIRVKQARNQAKFESAITYCGKRGMTFHVITEDVIYPKK